MNPYNSFALFVEEAVVPLKKLNPEWQRLDGGTGGNRKPFAYFNHDNKIWRVNSDTHFEPLLKAKQAIDIGLNPFIKTKNCLELIPELAEKPKRIYIYQHSK